MGKFQFYWRYFGNIQKAIIAVCVAMSPVADFIPDSWKHYFVPGWSWQTWLMVAMGCVVAFVVEEAHHRHIVQLAEQASSPVPQKTNTIAYTTMVIILISAGITVLWHNRRASATPTSAEGAAPQTQMAATIPPPTANKLPSPEGPPKNGRRAHHLAPAPVIPLQPTPQPAPTQTVNINQGIGGIGGTYINPQVTNVGHLAKKLTDDQVAEISWGLSHFADGSDQGDLIYCQMNNNESCSLAIQLVTALRGAHWNLPGSGYNRVSRTEYPDATMIAANSIRKDIPLKEAFPVAAFELAKYLKAIGFDVELGEDESVPAGKFRIYVGAKP